MFGLDDHQKGQACKAGSRVLENEAAGLRQVSTNIGAALLLDPVLGPLLTQDWVGVSRSHKGSKGSRGVQGYWAPSWFATALEAARDHETWGAFDKPLSAPGFTATARRPEDAVLRVLRAMAAGDDDMRETVAAALRLTGIRGALDVLGEGDGEGGDASVLGACLWDDYDYDD